MFNFFTRKDRPKPVDLKNLEPVYTDSAGKRYYKYPKSMAMPIERYGAMFRFLEFLQKGLSPEEDNTIDDAILQVYSDSGIADPTAGAKVVSLVMERKKRKELCFHTEVFYNILAIQWIREDENPDVVDNEIQMQKVDQMRQDAKSGKNGFFFQVPELKEQLKSLGISEQDVMKLIDKSEVEILALKEKIKFILQYKSTFKPSTKTGSKP